jgi:uroporphyrinogen decarboxylase
VATGTLHGVCPHDAPFLQAARGRATPHTPVWLMRQAGRYLPEYRAVRARLGFLELCRSPDAAAEVTLQPVERLGVDAAIVFADILLIVEPLGVGLEFARGEGPVIHQPARTEADVARLKPVDVESDVGYVFETVRRVRRALPGHVPLIGFAGAPFTVASYLVEGGPSRAYLHTKRLMHEEPQAWHRLLDILVDATARYLNGQLAAGAQAVQIFDSWVGVLAPEDYRAFVLPHSRALIRALTPGAPVIHFGTGTAGLLPLMREAGGDVIGLDWRVDLDAGWRAVGHDVAVQGNLDPAVLLARPPVIRDRVKEILDRAAARPGHIFNLGHGILPQTPVDHVKALVDMVHDMSDRRGHP